MKLNSSKYAFGVSSGKFLGFMVSQRGIEAKPEKVKAILEMSSSRTIKEVQSLTGRIATLNKFVSKATDKCLPFFKTLKKVFSWTKECKTAFQELNAALIREEDRLQLPVYYVNQAFQGAEARYPSIEKITFALIVASRKLRPYFKPTPSLTAIKAQALANFIAEFTTPENIENLWTVNTDGSSTQKGGEAGIVITSPEKDVLKYGVQLKFPVTNNEAEYEALLTRLKIARALGGETIMLKSDSQLVIRDQNAEADEVARSASTDIQDKMLDWRLEEQNSPSIQELQTLSVHTNPGWTSPILSFLREGRLPPDPEEAKKIQKRAARFTILNDKLYKRGYSQPYLRCIEEEEAKYVLEEVHGGICGDHMGAKSLVRKIMRTGYFWPTMQQDAANFVKKCDSCQRYGIVQ
ncbi:uncharacterized protein LOC115970125 [Quercus lobata]|uniref:uncharacterized protein LOC115970125 n=1 Tax=Quercus lobata TaxID=97700 RepID=UPI0012494A7E|nr:uncharacterized protein LOC115970125 [Quercus lobata]